MTVTLRAFAAEDAEWLVARHAVLYAQAEGFDDSFGTLVGQIVQGFVANHDPTREAGWIATLGHRRLGSIFCMAESVECAKLRLFLLEPDVRGTGLAQQMLTTCIDFARGVGFARMQLWTHESHRAAGRLYARNGFALIKSTPMHSFGQDVVSQIWIRSL